MMEFHPSGGTQQSFVQEGSVPRSHHRKGTPFKYLPLTNGTPSTYLVQNFASLITTAVNAMSIKYE